MRAFTPDVPDQEHQLLIENRIWFSDIGKLDDIFEGRPLFSWDGSPVSRARVETLIFRQEPELRARERDVLIERMLARFRDPVEREIMKAWMEIDMEAMYQASSVCCFFRNPCVPRFWARYAADGKGYALIFDFSLGWEFQSFRDHPAIRTAPMPVVYAAGYARPVVNLSFMQDPAEATFDPIEKALLTKSDEWGEQHEHRLFRVGIPAGLVEFPPRSLCGVVLGETMDQIHRQHLLDLRDARLEPLPFYQARRSTKQYGIDLIPLQ